MSIVLLTFTKKGLVGKLLIQSVRFCWALKGIVRVVRFLNFIPLLKVILAQ